MSPRALRLNLGDPSEARIYYAAHLVAARLGLFASEGLTVAFTRTESGGDSLRGGQIPAVLDGSADLAIGGPMVAMRMHQEGEAHLVCFCAAAAANPWVLVGVRPEPEFAWSRLAGCRVVDMAGIGTASFAFRRILAEAGLASDAVEIIPSRGTLAEDLAALAEGGFDYGFHALHALGGPIAAGRVVLVADLAPATGAIPWSAYIARPERIAADGPTFLGFTRAISHALRWIRSRSAGEVAALIAPDFPGMDATAIGTAVALYQANGVFAASPVIARADYDRFGGLLVDAGWLRMVPPFEALVDTAMAEVAQEVLP